MQKLLSSKIFIISVIALMLLIPLSMISEKISERSKYLAQAKESVGLSWTTAQKLVGPIIVIPYSFQEKQEVLNPKTNERSIQLINRFEKILMPVDRLTINSKINNEMRYKGIYKVPVYTTKIDIKAEIDHKSLTRVLGDIKKSAKNVQLGKAYLMTSISDPRGINSIPSLNWLKQKIAFNPGSKLRASSNGIHAYLPSLDKVTTDINFDFQLELRGMEELSFVAAAQQAIIKVKSSWPHPQFTGMFLPASRTVSATGYEAEWKITSFASNVEEKLQRCGDGQCSGLLSSSFGIKHIEAVDVYLQSERSIKYGLLFIGLTFITFFIFETVKKLPIHAIQYILVGSAIAIFYLLLVSLSEHISFSLAYLIATVCCVALLLYYLRYVLGEFKLALIFSTSLAILYGLLFVIISAEDFAFLMGGFLTFIMLGVVMVSTRNVDWYQENKS